MIQHTMRDAVRLGSFVLCAAVAACGGSDGPAGTPPVPAITAPATGSTFRAGDTITFAGNATDAEDGPLAASRLTWWAELHHDDGNAHAHPFVPETAGGTGSAAIPTRGETSSNIFYRFHLRATDSAGLSAEVTRDIQPQKAQVTLATQPAGLQLTLDGQPVTAPHTFTGVVGMQRDLGAANQAFNCRSYQFSTWNPGGGTSARTISTPAANTTYTAVFTDQGAAGNPPTVTLTTPANGSGGTVNTPINVSANAADNDGTIVRVEFFDGTTKIGEDTGSPYSISWTPSAAGAHSLTARATDSCGSATTSAAVNVTINPPGADNQPPTVAFTAPASLQDNITATLTISASATDNVGVASVEFQVDGVALATDTSSPYSATVDTNLYASGQHVLRVRASDAAGNQSAWVTRTVRFGGSRFAPTGFTRNTGFVTGLSSATAIAQLPAPDNRILIAQQGGTLLVRQANGAAIGTMLTLSVDAQGERGLLGVTPHPNFASNGFIYVYYTTQASVHNRISRFTVSGDTASNEVQLVNLPGLSATNHNGGALHFGNDGKLYVAVGDNAVGSKAPDLNDPFGKMLRFNDDGSIPNDNPFCTTQELRCAIWVRGLRNPFTFALRASDGRMHINDVGQNTWEEINLGVAGADYGWPASEGPTSTPGITAPLFAYDHSSTPDNTGGFFNGCSIIGGAFYPDTGPFPAAYRGSYYFTDFCNSVVGRIDLANGNAAYAFGTALASPVGVMVANDGSLLVLSQSGITRFSAP